MRTSSPQKHPTVGGSSTETALDPEKSPQCNRKGPRVTRWAVLQPGKVSLATSFVSCWKRSFLKQRSHSMHDRMEGRTVAVYREATVAEDCWKLMVFCFHETMELLQV